MRKPSSSEGMTVFSVAKPNQVCGFRVGEREWEIRMCTDGTFMFLKHSCIKRQGFNQEGVLKCNQDFQGVNPPL